MNIRRLCLLMAAIIMTMLLCVPAFAEESTLGVIVRSAPLVRAAGTRSGMVRVYLSSMADSSHLDVTVTGKYSVNGNTAMSLSTGDQVKIQFNEATGEITMTMNGVTYAMGKEMRLRRHQADGESALSFAQARYSSYLYPGDLQILSVQTSNGYRMYPIVHVYMEYYLYGVVPHEMSPSWPIEALKAQAVTARTYALNKMNQRQSYDYDVCDDAHCQVYNGYKGTTSNATLAVDETKGIVIMNDGVLSGTYYTASNGGQTEAVVNAWGGTQYPYLDVKDDPFDVLNTSSIRRRLTVYKDFDHASQNAALAEILTQKAQSQLGSTAVIETINSITPHTPKYKSPSRLYTLMDFGVTVRVNGVAQKATLTFSIFNDLEAKLGLNINSSNKNELWSVETQATTFLITVGRYGHGIGMSQRGAQQMAKMGYTYDQILGFYYEGCERVQYTFIHSILPPGSSNDIYESEAPATISPAVQNQATLALPGVEDVAPLRYTAEEEGKILTGVPNGSAVTVLAKGEAWTLVRYGEINGYLPTAALVFTVTPPVTTTESPTMITLWATVSGTNSLNFRKEPSTSAEKIGTLSEGTALCILSTSGEWVKVQSGNKVGYVSADYLTYHSSYPGSTNSDFSAMVSLGDANATAPLLATPSTSAAVLYQVPHGAQVTVLSNDGSWCQVEVAGVRGYLLTSQLDFGATGETLPDVTDGPQAEGITAIVNSDASTLNLREGPSTSYDIIAEIPKGTYITVTVYGDTWCLVSWGSLNGYVMTQYLLFPEEETPTPTPEESETPTPTPSDDPTPTPPPEGTAWVLTTVNYINLRETPSTEGEIITTIPGGDELIVLEKGGTWSFVKHGVASGYVLSSNLTYTQPLPAIGILYVDTDVDPLSLRDEPDLYDSIILTRVPRGEAVLLLQEMGDWCHVQYGAYVGYCATRYLSRSKPAEYVTDETPLYDPSLVTVTGWEAVINTEDEEKLPLLKWCSMQAPELTVIPYGNTVQLLQRGDIWCKISFEGETGYCLTDDLILIAPTGE